MSAADNKRLMQAIYAKLAEGDGTLFRDHLADDVVMLITGRNSWSQTFRGKASLLRDLYGYLSTLTQNPRKTIPWRFIADEDIVVVEARGEMKRKDGVPYENEYCLIFRFDNQKIVEMREYLDSALCEEILGAFPRNEPKAASAN
jgi:uncharacterized protein